MELTSDPSLLSQVTAKEIEAKEFGFYWERLEQLMDQIKSECAEIEEAFQSGNQAHLQEELGDLIHASISLTLFCHCDPHETLQKSLQKFEKRFHQVVELAKKEGRSHLRGCSFETLMHYWKEAKKQQG